MPALRIPRSSAQAGLLARQLAQRLAAMQPGETVTYTELSELIGLSVQQRRDLLDTARKLVRDEHRKVFDVLINTGLVCLNSQGIVGTTDTKLTRVHRAGLRLDADLNCVEPQTLTPLESVRWLAQKSIVASVTLLAHPKAVNQLAETGQAPALPWDQDAHKDVFKPA